MVVTHADGSVSGHATFVFNRQFGFSVTCMTIEGNRARVGFRVETSTNPAIPPGSGSYVTIEDNGDGPTDPPDRMSLPAPRADAQQHCDVGLTAPLAPVLAGSQFTIDANPAVHVSLGDAVSELAAMAASGGAHAPMLLDAAAQLQVAIQELTKQPADEQAAIGSIQGGVGDLEGAVKNGFDAGAGTRLMNDVADLARRLATEAIQLAEAGGGDPAEIAEAVRSLGVGDALVAAGQYKDAVKSYKDALKKARGSL